MSQTKDLFEGDDYPTLRDSDFKFLHPNHIAVPDQSTVDENAVQQVINGGNLAPVIIDKNLNLVSGLESLEAAKRLGQSFVLAQYSTPQASSSEELEILVIKRDGGTQSRAAINPDTVEDYKIAMLSGEEFPAVIVFYDGCDYWLGDGFHRAEAALRAGKLKIKADIRQGTRRDAVLYSCGANAKHGLQRTNADKRRAVTVLLQDEEWKQWSDREIARKAGVHHNLVASVRTELGQEKGDRLYERNGKTHTQKVKPKAQTEVKWVPQEGEEVEIFRGEYEGRKAEVRVVSEFSALCAIEGMEDQRKWVALVDMRKAVAVEAEGKELRTRWTSTDEEAEEKRKELGIPKTGLPEQPRNEGIQEEEQFPATYTTPSHVAESARYAEMAIDLVVMPADDLRKCFEYAINQFSAEQIKVIHEAIAPRLENINE